MNTPESEGAQNPYQITVRFGNEILQAGFTAVPNLVLDHYGILGITSAEMMFIIHIWQYWWTEKNPYPSLQAIADRMATSRRQVRRYTESLKEKGLLRVNERRQPGYGQVTSEYDFASLIEQVLLLASAKKGGRSDLTVPPRSFLSEGGRSKLSEAPRTEMTPEEYIKTNTQEQEELSNFEVRNVSTKKMGTKTRGLEKGLDPVREQDPIRDEEHQIVGSLHTAASTAPAGFVTPADALRIRSQQLAEQGDDQERHGRPPGSADEREQLRAYLTDFARELHDAAPLAATISRVLSLMRKAGVPRERWSDLLYQARAITQEHSAQITTPAEGIVGRGTKNKVPYFLAVLESLLGLRPYGDVALSRASTKSGGRSSREQRGSPPSGRMSSLRGEGED